MSAHFDEETIKKPFSRKVLANAVEIIWPHAGKRDEKDVECYEIRYKKVEEKRWKSMKTEKNDNFAMVSGLQSCSSYQFKVRACYCDDEGPFTEESNPITTTTSPAREILSKCLQITDGNPSTYKIAVRQSFVNEKHRLRKCIIDLAEKDTTGEEKTIMLVGSTGAGKSTLIDGMINFICGVLKTDEFRFTVMDLMNDEKAENGDQTRLQTDWITCYSIENSNFLGYKLNIIDTPGFGDSRGIEKDNELFKQIKEFFSVGGENEVAELNAVCFVSQPLLSKLTPTELYTVDSVLSVFGKDIAKIFVNMITFGDGKTPHVVESLKNNDVPSDIWLQFNNSALFYQSDDTNSASFQNIFWEMGMQSYESFFKELRTMSTVSLSLTKEVLKEREQLQIILEGLLSQVNRLLSLKNEKIKTMKCIKENEAAIEKWKDFEYKTETVKIYRVDLRPGERSMLCENCQFNCHFPCEIKTTEAKHRCVVFVNGRCTVCPEKCMWNVHDNKGYKFDVVKTEKRMIYHNIKEAYEKSQREKKENETLLRSITREMDPLSKDIYNKITQTRTSLTKLSDIALKSDPLNNVERLERLIQYEEKQNQPGFQNRIKFLNAVLKQSKMAKDAMSGSLKRILEEDC